MPEIVLGVDGCKGGWCVVVFESGVWVKTYLRANFREVLEVEEAKKAKYIFVDMPIGLVGGLVATKRSCDEAAREILGVKSSSVFNAPSQVQMNIMEGFNFDGTENYHLMNGASWLATKHGLSWQTLNISKKILSLQYVLSKEKEWRNKVIEFHPEIAFMNLNQNKLLTSSKKSNEGRKERWCFLKHYTKRKSETDMKQIVDDKTVPNKVAKDDILDAASGPAAYYAMKAKGIELRYLPGFSKDRKPNGQQIAFFGEKPK